MPIHRVREIEQSGRGGLGIVHRVQDDVGNQYALKTFSLFQPLDPALETNVKRRFEREAPIQSGLSRPNIVPVIDKDTDHDPPRFLMLPAEGYPCRPDVGRWLHAGATGYHCGAGRTARTSDLPSGPKARKCLAIRSNQ